MSDTNHHRRFVEALRSRWDAVGGPVSLTSFLDHCRPEIAPLLARRIPWSWIAPRVIAVYRNPGADVPPDLASLGSGEKKTLIQLYSRTTLRKRRPEPDAPRHVAPEPVAPEAAQGHAATRVSPSRPPQGSDPPDDRRARRARIRQGAEISKRLGQFE
jgi:hypothetical protein